MENNNIISPTTDLAELDNDYNDWCGLPIKMRYRANDECIRLHNCTVPDLYAKYRQAILQSNDEKNMDKDNIKIYENTIYSYDNYEELLNTSTNLQLNPYIVILDPSIDNMEELNSKFDSFCCLNAKNKKISNDFSWQIWGYNVPNMYEILVNKLNAVEQDDSNIKTVSETKKLEDAVRPLVDRCNHALLSNNILEYFNIIWKDNRDDLSIVENTIYDKCMDINEDEYLNIDESIFPKVVPWFRDDELDYCKSISKFEGSYKSAVESAMEKLNKDPNNQEYIEAVLSLGWNPSIPLSESNYDYIRNRQAKGNYFNPIDIRSIKISNINEGSDINCIPIFFIMEHKNQYDNFYNIADYSKVGLSFDSSLKSIYTFNGVDTNFKGFILESIKDYNFIDVVVLYVDNNALEKIKSQCIKLKDNDTELNNFGSVYGIITKTLNRINPDNLKLIYSQYIDMLFRLSNIDLSTSELNFDKFGLNKSANIFKVYSGNSTEYNQEKVNDILKIISNNSNRKEFLSEFCYNFTNSSDISLEEKIQCINSYISIIPVITVK